MTWITDRRTLLRNSALWAAALPAFPSAAQAPQAAGTARKNTTALFDVKEFGASGIKSDDARPAIQNAIDACAASGGGIVYLPPGDYTSGTITLRSHVRFHLEGGATLYASKNPADFNAKPVDSKASLFFAENVENITIEGRGTVNGQSEYEWRDDDIDDVFVKPAKDRMKAAGKSIRRSFPKGHPSRTVYPHLVWIGGSVDVRITGVSFIYSPSWTMAFHQCDRLSLDGIYVHTKLNEAVWADGIDLDGCKDVCVANSTIISADDCFAIFSGDFWGPPRACEDITITNCRLSSSSCAVKFTEGDVKGVHRVTISNCVITEDSSGFAFLSADGGIVSDILISNCVLNLRRFDWFWGQGGPMGMVLKNRDEWKGASMRHGAVFPGAIRNIVMRGLIIHAVGPGHIQGHPDSWIDGLTLENIKLFVSADPAAPFDDTVDAMRFSYARNLKLRNVEIHWETPELQTWRSALSFENVEALKIEGFEGRQALANRDTPAVVFKDVRNAVVRDSTPAEGTGTFIEVAGDSGEIVLFGNDFRKAATSFRLAKGAKENAVRALNNIEPSA
jgi:polygalacturonase